MKLHQSGAAEYPNLEPRLNHHEPRYGTVAAHRCCRTHVPTFLISFFALPDFSALPGAAAVALFFDVLVLFETPRVIAFLSLPLS